MSQTLVNIGFGNLVVASRIVAIITPSSAPMKRLKEEARQQGKLIDATQGRKTRAVIITDSDHVILSAVQPATVAQRFAAEGESRLAEGESRLAESAREEQAS